MTCTIKFWRDMDGGTTCGKGGPKFAVTDGPGGPFLRGDQKFRDRTPFFNVERMRTRSLVPKPKTTVIDLEVRQVDTRVTSATRGYCLQRSP